MFEPEQTVPVACPASTWIVLHDLVSEPTSVTSFTKSHTVYSLKYMYIYWLLANRHRSTYYNKQYNYYNSLTSISHRALLLVAEVADCRPVVRRKTYCFFLWSSHVRNFSCSAWNNRTTSPWRRKNFPSEEPHNSPFTINVEWGQIQEFIHPKSAKKLM